jgi:REP element-mobilizing transposase RayT
VSNVHRLRHTDCIFFVSVNLRPKIGRFDEPEYDLLLTVLEASRRRLGFLLCGYVLMPDHWHALLWPQHPLLIGFVGALREAPSIPMARVFARAVREPPLQHAR